MGDEKLDELLGISIQRTIHFTLGTISTVLNSIILYLIFFKTPKHLAEYSYFLFHITFSDLLFNIFLTFLMEPMPFFPLLGLAFVGPMRYLEPLTGHLIQFDIAMYLFNYCMLAVNFACFYRYLWVARQRLVRIYVNWKVQLAYGFIANAIAFGVIWTHHLHTLGREESRAEVYHEFPNLASGQLEGITVFVFQSNKPLEFLVLTALPISAMNNLFWAQRVFANLNSLRISMSESTYNINRRMTQSLIVQTLSPLVLLCVPMVVVFYAIIADYRQILTIGFGTLAVTLLALNSIANALSTLFFVKPYTRVLIHWFERLNNRRRDHGGPGTMRTRVQSIASIYH